ncbi:hypothetical protein VCR15J2_60045 [Vibrio coralliirubri]|nr:hypothetical protein VCR4J2_340114 [Vibrio coralliirubri]CDT64485.1 hypothetical protein VCR1J2_90033 [Vibrio coralliirubri]CDT76839.1 hypothetical protein VCR15J2_60045 [Vibrio coralliirubri]CDU00399.1 hypothetical protein VCR8J2_70033 [Vibrio coralliirubri]CDU12688.1 hypothetical protein VCR17J2_380058 [Vibrio coralliirubri]
MSLMRTTGNYSNPVHSYQVRTHIAGYVTALPTTFQTFSD